MTLLDTRLTSVLKDPLSAAKASGKPIVLYVSNDVPIELIHACGCFPLQLPTAARSEYTRADRYLEPNFEPMVRSALEQLLQGELSAASMLVLPRSNDAWQRFYYYLCELARSFGEQLPEPFMFDLQKLPTESSAHYNLQSIELFAHKLQALAGTTLSSAVLSESVTLYNRIRAQLQKCRYQRQPRLSGADAMQLFIAIQRQDPIVVEEALRDLADSEDVTGTPTLLIGSTHDTPQLHHAIARTGGQVALDFHSRGDWSFGPAVAEDSEPLKALSEHYHKHSLSSRSHPPPLQALLDAAAVSGAQAAVFFYYAEEEALTWDYPAQSKALSERGIRSLLLPRQPYPISTAVEAPLKAFFTPTPKNTP
jgi:benzoyl-CoA reductase/2-hydroxyglutaryl-CoA dehydratase subunit BcrC/BadD/HgdB